MAGDILSRMTVDTIPPVAIPEVEEELPRRRRRRPSLSGPPWLARVLVESFFIMFSILLALAVENWRENRQHRRLAQQSLQIFEREIRQNLARIDDVTPYHSGLRSVVAEALVNPAQAADMRSIVEGLQPTVLLNTAWQTALATGALTHIDVETVSALSLTYSIQERFREDTRASLPRITVGETDQAEFTRQVQRTHAYLNELITAEQELRGVYKQAMESIRAGMRDPRPVEPRDSLL
jgi:hypothetical protein